MDHVIRSHWTNENSEKNKSFFYYTHTRDSLFTNTLQYPDFQMPHPLKDNRTWLFKKFARVVGKHGYNAKDCWWVALCVADGQYMVTMYPVTHPTACYFVREFLHRNKKSWRPYVFLSLLFHKQLVDKINDITIITTLLH